jgi:hypothetical protein
MPALPFSITLGRPSRGELLSLVGAVLLALEGLHRRNTDMRRRVALLTLGALLTLATAVPVLAADAALPRRRAACVRSRKRPCTELRGPRPSRPIAPGHR